jgi:hypothetical protein
VGVIDGLEVVEVEQQQRRGLAGRPRFREQPGGLGPQRPAVQQPVRGSRAASSLQALAEFAAARPGHRDLEREQHRREGGRRVAIQRDCARSTAKSKPAVTTSGRPSGTL